MAYLYFPFRQFLKGLVGILFLADAYIVERNGNPSAEFIKQRDGMAKSNELPGERHASFQVQDGISGLGFDPAI